MGKDWKYILYISAAFGLFVLVKLLGPKQYNWAVTYAHEDKNPYGAYALNELLGSVFPEDKINRSYKTIYEIGDSLDSQSNILIISSGFSGGKEDADVLLTHVGNGGTAFIAAQYFWDHFADTLKITTQDYLFKDDGIFTKNDSSALKFANHRLDSVKEFYFRRDNIHNYFSRFDTTRTTVVVKNDRNMPIAIKVEWGKGNFILCTTPLIFTNIYLLSGDNHELAAGMLSYLPDAPLEWTEYYQMGRMEIGTPLRFVLTTEPLRWAYYILIISTLLFMIFELKRKQRIIPVITPLPNTTLEFVSTIGNLYYQQHEHKNIAEKKIQFLLDYVRTTYWLSTSNLDALFIENLAKKSGKPVADVNDLIKSVTAIQSKDKITAAELTSFNKQMEQFMSAAS
jgi:hypothetical protein